MLKTNYQTNKNSFAKTFEQHFLSELSSNEASLYTGGFTLTNNTNNDVKFYPFDDATDPSPQTLLVGQDNIFNGEYILYDKIIGPQSFKPVIQQVRPNGSYSFKNRGNELYITGGTGNY